MTPVYHLLRVLPALAVLAPLALGRTITVTNSCPSTIWPGMNTGTGTVPSQATGWELAAGATTTFDVPEDWTAGRIWARTGCTTDSTGAFVCLTGNCGPGTGGSQLCTTGDTPPATLAEFTLANPGTDNYDISLVDGFNVPLNIVPSDSSCTAPQCQNNVNAVCPPLLRTAIDSTGTNFACATACNMGWGEEEFGNRDCCTGAYVNSTLCQSCGVDFYNVFKDQCNQAYAYAYDEKSGTALWTCSSSPNYEIIFCPAGSNFQGTSNSDVSEKYASDTATCTSIATTFSATFSVGPSPSVAQTSGTLSVVATNAAGVGGQAAIGMSASASSSSSGFPGGTSLSVTSTSASSGPTSSNIGASSGAVVNIAETSATSSAPTSSGSAGSCKGNPHDGGAFLSPISKRHGRKARRAH